MRLQGGLPADVVEALCSAADAFGTGTVDYKALTSMLVPGGEDGEAYSTPRRGHTAIIAGASSQRRPQSARYARPGQGGAPVTSARRPRRPQSARTVREPNRPYDRPWAAPTPRRPVGSARKSLAQSRGSSASRRTRRVGWGPVSDVAPTSAKPGVVNLNAQFAPRRA